MSLSLPHGEAGGQTNELGHKPTIKFFFLNAKSKGCSFLTTQRKAAGLLALLTH